MTVSGSFVRAGDRSLVRFTWVEVLLGVLVLTFVYVCQCGGRAPRELK